MSGVQVTGSKLWLANSRILNNGVAIGTLEEKAYNDNPTFAYISKTIIRGNRAGASTYGGIIYFTSSIIEKNRGNNLYSNGGKIYIDGIPVTGFDVSVP